MGFLYPGFLTNPKLLKFPSNKCLYHLINCLVNLLLKQPKNFHLFLFFSLSIYRCPSYDNLPKECFTTSEQGKCCESIKCVLNNGSFVKPNAQFPVVGSFHGGFSGFRPGVSYNPGLNNTSGSRSM